MNQRNVCSLTLLALSLATPALAVDPASLLHLGAHSPNPFATSLTTVPAASASVYHFASADFPGAEMSIVWDQNNNTAVGEGTFNSTSSAFGFTLSGGLYQTFTVPGSLPGAAVTSINAAGEMVGIYNNLSGNTAGFLDNGGVFTSINEPTGSTTPIGINKSGEIVGGYTDTSNVQHGFSTKKGVTFNNFDFPGGTSTTAAGINTAGKIVGLWIDASSITHGFTLAGGVFTSIDFPGAASTVAIGINDTDEIAGYYTDASNNFHGFIYAQGNYSTVDVPGATGTELTRIKNNGQITGVYIDAMNETHGLLGQ
jgi:hypothetical protein